MVGSCLAYYRYAHINKRSWSLLELLLSKIREKKREERGESLKSSFMLYRQALCKNHLAWMLLWVSSVFLTFFFFFFYRGINNNLVHFQWIYQVFKRKSVWCIDDLKKEGKTIFFFFFCSNKNVSCVRGLCNWFFFFSYDILVHCCMKY